jgi:hypothetical protein
LFESCLCSSEKNLKFSGGQMSTGIIFLRILLVIAVLMNGVGTRQPSAAYSGREPAQTPEKQLYSLVLGAEPLPSQEPVPLLAEKIAQESLQRGNDKAIHLEVEVEPAIYIPGKPLQVRWKAIGLSAEQRARASLVIRPPSNARPENLPQRPAANGSLTLPLTSNAGTISWSLDTNASPPFVFTLFLYVDGKVVNYATATVNKARFWFTPDRQGDFQGLQGRVRLKIPPRATQEPLLLDIREPAPQSLHGLSLSWHPVEIVAVGKTTQRNVHL